MFVGIPWIPNMQSKVREYRTCNQKLENIEHAIKHWQSRESSKTPQYANKHKQRK
jgi:hypothetical protein